MNNNQQRNYPAKTFDRYNMELGDDWGQAFDIGRIDEIAVNVSQNDALLRVSPKLDNDGVDWQEPFYLPSGGIRGFSDGSLNAFGKFQLKRANAGSPSTVHVTAICKGGAA